MALIISGGGAGSGKVTKPNYSLHLPKTSNWWLPLAIGLVLVLVAAWKTKYRSFFIGFCLLILVGIVLEWWPAFDTQFHMLAQSYQNSKLGKGLA